MMEEIKPRDMFVLRERAPRFKSHEVVFHIKPLNMDRLEALVEDMSSPQHEKYQKWLTFDELSTLTANPNGSRQVLNWLTAQDILVKIPVYFLNTLT